MNKIIISDFDFHGKLSSGLNKLANAVKSTLGPQGQNVMIQHFDDAMTVTKDGVTVASIVSLSDPIENIGATLVKSVAQKTVDSSGDGTTTATVLLQAIFNEGKKNIAAGANSMELKKGMDLAVTKVVEYLASISDKVENNEQLRIIATIASNNNQEIGELIARAFEKVGQDGMITIEDGKNADTEVKYIEGMNFDRGFQTHHFITDHVKQEVVLEKPYILIHDRKINNMKTLYSILNEMNPANDSLLIISDDLEDEAFATIVMNKVKNNFRVCAVKAPLFGDWRRPILEDIAIVTGGKVISEELGYRLETSKKEHLGRADKVVISSGRTIIYNGHGDKDGVQKQIESLKAQVETTEGEFQLKQLKSRLARLKGGIATIFVGGATEIEMKEKKDRIDDALQATRAAIEEGIIPGGGVSYIRAVQKVFNPEFLAKIEGDQRTGALIIATALQAPIRTMLENAGEKVDVVVDKVQNGDADFGYNAKSRAYENFKSTGVMDPTKVARLCLENSASVAGMLLTSKTIILNDPSNQKEAPIQGSGRSFEDLI